MEGPKKNPNVFFIVSNDETRSEIEFHFNVEDGPAQLQLLLHAFDRRCKVEAIGDINEAVLDLAVFSPPVQIVAQWHTLKNAGPAPIGGAQPPHCLPGQVCLDYP